MKKRKIASVLVMVMMLLLMSVSICGAAENNSYSNLQGRVWSNIMEELSALYQTLFAMPQSEGSLSTKPDGVDLVGLPSAKITVGEKTFLVSLEDNQTARGVIGKMPFTINMGELNGNEKFYYFDDDLPTNSQAVEQIKNGDLLLYGSDCLVLFYENFASPYSYSKIGHLDDPAGLAEALGSGSVNVTFSLVAR